jgi:Lysozyme like domain
MAKRTPAQVYAAALQAGFDPSSAAVATAIAGAESGYDDASLIGLEGTTQGPAFGLWHITTSKTDTGAGTVRDIAALAGDDLAQARAAYQLSGGGKDWTAFPAYTSGTYQGFLPTTQALAQPDGDGGSGPWPTWGPSWLPWNWPSNAANAATAQVLGGARNLVLEALVVVLGLGLVAAGAITLVRPQLRQQAVAAARQAVKLA